MERRVYRSGHTLLQVQSGAPVAKCPECAKDRGMLYRALSGDLPFPEAFSVWIGHRTLETNGVKTDASYLAWRTERDYRCCARALEKFRGFQHLRLDGITPDLLMDYQQARAVNVERVDGVDLHPWERPAGANRIRKEIDLMVRILRDARLWGQEQEDSFLRLRPVESDLVRAMSVSEQHRFLHVASSKLQYRLIYQYSIAALQTTASTNEMRSLRLCDILLSDRIIQIPRAGAKNRFRMRAIPIITEDAVWAFEGLIARARELGSVSPSHYLFPLRVNPGRSAEKAPLRERYDPSRPMSDSGLKKQWDAVRKAALLPDLRIYDLRHTGITRMAETGVPLPVAMSFAGHMTPQMQRRYTAISMASQRGWGATVWGDGELRNGGPAAVRELSEPRLGGKPVASERLQMYQEVQHFHRKA